MSELTARREAQIELLDELEIEMQTISGQASEVVRRMGLIINRVHDVRCKLELQRTDNEHYLANVGR